LLILATILCVTFALSSCAGAPAGTSIVFDETIPEEQSVIIRFGNVEVTSYNGIPVPVRERRTALGFQSTWRNVILPAGEMEFIFGAIAMNRFVVRDASFRYTFMPGEYIVSFGLRDGVWGIFIFGESVRNPDAFIPLQR